MTKSLRLLVLSGTLALLASPVFAASGGTNTGNPDPPGNGTSNTTMTTSSTSSSSTATVIQTILTYLGL